MAHKYNRISVLIFGIYITNDQAQRYSDADEAVTKHVDSELGKFTNDEDGGCESVHVARIRYDTRKCLVPTKLSDT